MAASPASPDRRDPRPALWFSTAVIGLVVLAWPFTTQRPVTLDLSWQVGLHQAVADGLRFGPEVVFTYGPLGFLNTPTPFVGPTSAIAFLVLFGLYLATVGETLVAARRVLPLWPALLVTLLFARGMAYVPRFELLEILVFMLGVEALRRAPIARPDVSAVVLGLVAAVALLGKLNVAAVVFLMGIVIALGMSRVPLRGLAIYAATFAVAAVALWLITGQQLVDLLPYARGSLEIVSGYSDAMAADKPDLRWVILAFVAVAAMLIWVAYRSTSGWPRWRRLALGALVMILLIAVWKLGFVRNHFAIMFGMMAMAMLALMPRTLPTSTAAAMFIGVGIAFVAVAQVPAIRYIDLPSSVVQFAIQARNTLFPWRWEPATAATRRHLAQSFDVPPDVLAEIAGRTVHVDPYHAAVATAYPIFTWRPEPIFQSYSAYTPYLDEQNAALLRSSDRPERILRHADQFRTTNGGRARSVDGRFYWFESPAAAIERLCRYRESVADGDWQVLAATGRECGQWQQLGSITAGLGETIPVPAAPAPGQLVAVRIHGLGDDLAHRIRSAAWRGPEWSVELDGIKYRLVAATAADGLVLSVPPEAQGTPPFAFGPSVRSIAVMEKGSRSRDRLTYEFFAVPLSGP